MTLPKILCVFSLRFSHGAFPCGLWDLGGCGTPLWEQLEPGFGLSLG